MKRPKPILTKLAINPPLKLSKQEESNKALSAYDFLNADRGQWLNVVTKLDTVHFSKIQNICEAETPALSLFPVALNGHNTQL